MDSQASGQILNLITNDLGRLEYVNLFLSFLVIGPLQSGFIIYLLITMIDVSVLSGLIIMVLVVPTQIVCGKIYDHFRRITSRKCDKRINLLTEIFNGIKVVKMYCWETPFKKIIDELRKRELLYQKLLYFNTAMNSIIHLTTPTTITFLSVTFFVFLSDRSLEPSYIVLAMSFYRLINDGMFFCFTYAFTNLIGANVSVKRIQAFLLQDSIQNKNDFKQVESPYIKLNDLTVSWKADLESFRLQNISFQVNENELTAIIGPVGSGKFFSCYM
jgi:ATP-binding cassette subfamily C (CFTR/MRP) protein 4